MSNQTLKKIVNEPLKTIFHLPHYVYLLSKANFKIDHPTVQNCVCSNALFSFKINIFEFFSTEIFAMKVDESIKTIFYLPHYAYLLGKANFKIDHAHHSKLCLLKCTIFLENQHFRIFQHSNIRNDSRWVNKNHFLSYTLPISLIK